MNDHLSPILLNGLADGELSADQLASANEHLASCPSCTSSALIHTMLKSATAKAGRRYSLPPYLQEELARQAQQEASQPRASRYRIAPVAPSRLAGRLAALGWATACVLLLLSVSLVLVQRSAHRTAMRSSAYAALVTEVGDQHIAALTADATPQVLSSDRHTVKPWFQGKIPFSFNLPEGLPSDTTLDGANLTYLGNQPVAQLLYSIGKHRISVFVRQRTGTVTSNGLLAERSGFHVAGFTTGDFEVLAVSDVDPARLSDLVGRFAHAQTPAQKPPK
jgi:anti-sigma factor RsiW